MELIELTNQLISPKRVPIKALRALMRRKKESTPVLLNILKSTLEDYKRVPDDRLDYLYALYLLSYFREPRAFSYVVKFAQLPADWVDRIMGDTVTEGLASWLVSTYNGDLGALKKVIENKTAYTYSRSAALKSLIGLLIEGELTREEVIDYLRALMQSELVNDYDFATALVSTAYKLHPGELFPEIVNLYDRDLVETLFIDLERVEEALHTEQKQWLSQYACVDKYHLPITNVLDHVSWLYIKEDEAGELYPVGSPSKLGRNDKCFCGSDKKYKKCCLSKMDEYAKREHVF